MTETPVKANLADLALSRRRLLRGGLTVLGGLAASTLAEEALGGLGVRPVPPIERPTLPAGYDPSAHSWAMVCDPQACIGCGVCVEACRTENRLPAEPGSDRTWVERRRPLADGSVEVTTLGDDDGDDGRDAPGDRAEDGAGASGFVPRLCMQCENPPCVSVCPVGATYRTADGVVLVDERRCIGCGYCVVACPYGARYLVPEGPITPAGVAGVADKCTFCYHRITRGFDPACVEVCPVGARVFGDLRDVASPVSELLDRRRAEVLRPELGTKPQVYYLTPTTVGPAGPGSEV